MLARDIFGMFRDRLLVGLLFEFAVVPVLSPTASPSFNWQSRLFQRSR